MIVAALDMVVNYAAVPLRIERLLDILFTIAFAFQGAIWARELILGVDDRNARRGPGRDRARQRARDHPRAGQRRLVRASRSSSSSTISGSTSPPLSPASASAASPSASPLRASSPTSSRRSRSCSTTRSGAATRSASTDHRHGRADRPQDDPVALDHRRAGRDVEHQPARAELHNFARPKPPDHACRSGSSTRPRPTLLEQCRPSAKARSKRARAAVRALRRSGFGAVQHRLRAVYRQPHDRSRMFARPHRRRFIAVLRRLRRAWIEFAYPTQTTFTAAPDGTLIMPWRARLPPN